MKRESPRGQGLRHSHLHQTLWLLVPSRPATEGSAGPKQIPLQQFPLPNL